MLTVVVVTAIIIVTIQAVEIEIHNAEIGDVWVGIQGNPGKPNLESGGFILAPGQSRHLTVPDDWAGRFWPRTWCDRGSKHCLTGDCGNREQCQGNGGAPPASLVEITLRGWGGLDYYDISLVDGYNINVSIEPVGGTGDGSRYSCKKASCHVHLNDECPNELRVKQNGITIGCKSACLAFNTDQYCCRNAHGTPQTCKSSDWPVNYPDYFKSRCPDAYSYAYDDHKSTFTCTGATKYRIVFGG